MCPPILPWKRKKYTSGISLGNSSRLPFSNNEECSKLRRVQIKYMFSVDGRNLKRILTSEFVSGLSHFAGCPVISAHEFQALGHNISLFLQQPFSFIFELRLPKLHSALWRTWWRFWVSADQCSLRICKILSTCQLVCPFKPPFAYGTLCNRRGFLSVSPHTQVHNHSMRALVNYPPRSKVWKNRFFIKTMKNHNICTFFSVLQKSLLPAYSNLTNGTSHCREVGREVSWLRFAEIFPPKKP